MFNSSVLDVAIGVIFGFLAVSFVTSALVEAINSALKLRAVTLLAGVKALVNDPGFTGLARQLYEHTAINPLGFSPSAAQAQAGATAAPLKNKPAYIDPKLFADALLDITGISAVAGAGSSPVATVAALQAALAANVAAVANPQIKSLLEGIVNRTAGDISAVRQEVATWFDNAMDRVGGSFKRQTQLFSFLIALLLAALLNVDTIHLATALWEHPAVVDQLKVPDTVQASVSATMPSEDATAAQEALAIAASNVTTVLNNTLPVGWSPGNFLKTYIPDSQTPGQGKWQYIWCTKQVFASLVGWLATAIASLFGAPFWFDTLQTFVRLKGAGPSPKEKLNGNAAAA